MYRVVSRAVEQPAMHAYYSFGRGFDGWEKCREACAESADARRTQEVYPQRLLWYPGSGGVWGWVWGEEDMVVNEEKFE